jgi:hypothetical protein
MSLPPGLTLNVGAEGRPPSSSAGAGLRVSLRRRDLVASIALLGAIARANPRKARWCRASMSTRLVSELGVVHELIVAAQP